MLSVRDVAAADRDLAAPRGLDLDTRQDAATATAVDILSLERAATVEVAIVRRALKVRKSRGSDQWVMSQN